MVLKRTLVLVIILVLMRQSFGKLLGLEVAGNPCPASLLQDDPFVTCRTLGSMLRNFCSKTSGYHNIARVKCTRYCLNDLGFLRALPMTTPKPGGVPGIQQYDCSAAATWLKPIKAVDKDLKGNDQSEYCKKVVRKNSARCDSREFGYMCAGTCNIDADIQDAPITTTKKP